MPQLPTIPETITVHLGPPESSAENVTVPFLEYVANVASSEIYPTWPENAIRANMYAQISFALNRIYTEYYRTRGFDFDITNNTAYDQYFVQNRDIFEALPRAECCVEHQDPTLPKEPPPRTEQPSVQAVQQT